MSDTPLKLDAAPLAAPLASAAGDDPWQAAASAAAADSGKSGHEFPKAE